MSVIKSSFEIAMQRAETVKVDQHFIACEEKKREGARLAANAIRDENLNLAAVLGESRNAYYECFLEGIIHTLLSNMKLPSSKKSLENLHHTAITLLTLSPQLKETVDAFSQEMSAYLNQRSHIFESIAKQFSHLLRQKEEQLTQQTGQRVRLKVENLPEFQTAYKEQLYMIDSHYQEIVDQIHWQIRQWMVKNNACST
ncbi:MAG: DUF6657 family protein [Spirochaetia bacterium]